MERKYIRKTFFIYLIIFTFSSCIGHKVKNSSKAIFELDIFGRYQKVGGKELLILNENKKFLCLRNSTSNSDVVIPRCDTIASGFWDKKEGFITLKNKSDFNDILYSIEESVTNEKDSIKFKIVLPEEDALSYDIFRFIITHISPNEVYKVFDSPEFSIKRKSEYLMFGFSINNIGANSEYKKKSYQRLSFDIFENYRPKNTMANSFIIKVKNFDQCFYEAMEIDGEIIGIERGSLIWRGNTYKKITSPAIR